MVVAVGSLAGLWLDLPEDITDRQTLETRFEEYFGLKWPEVMIRGSLSYVYHQHWNAYLSVACLEPMANVPLPALLADLRKKKAQVYQVLAG